MWESLNEKYCHIALYKVKVVFYTLFILLNVWSHLWNYKAKKFEYGI